MFKSQLTNVDEMKLFEIQICWGFFLEMFAYINQNMPFHLYTTHALSF